MIEVTITGREQLTAKLDKSSDNIRNALRTEIRSTVIDLQGQVQAKLSGPVLKARTGRLRNSVATKVEEDYREIRGTVAAKTPYAAIHEYGFQGVENVREHLRTITQAFGRPLAQAKDVTVKAHARTVDMPERSFLRTTLAENAARIGDRLRHAVQQAIYDEGLQE